MPHNVEIWLERETFLPGEIVAGQVQIQLSEPLEVRGTHTLNAYS